MLLNLTIQQETGLRILLQSAQRTEFYGTWLRPIPTPLSRCLDLLPPVEFRHFDENRAAFRNPKIGRLPKPEFRYPLQPAPKILVLLEGFQQSSTTRNVFDLGNADTLAAPVGVLRNLAKIAGPQRYPVVAFTGVRHGTLSQDDRDLFWKAFRVPVFEQFLGLENEAIALECEAHDGLHVQDDRTIVEICGGQLVLTALTARAYPVLRLATGFTAVLEPAPCACGSEGLRLMGMAPMATGGAGWR